MAAVLARSMSPPLTQSSGATPTMQHLTLNTSLADARTPRGAPSVVPNKHIPYSSPGPAPAPRFAYSSEEPEQKSPEIALTSILYPADRFEKIENEPSIYKIDAATLQDALDHIATQPLPDPELVFPWLHGLHPDNHFQLNFFSVRSKSMRRTPKCFRGITIVKAGGDLSFAKLKGAVAPEEFLFTVPRAVSPTRSRRSGSSGSPVLEDKCFLEADPMIGFSCRNFHIQACKMATVSDIIIYRDDSFPHQKLLELARQLAQAQNLWSIGNHGGRSENPKFNTFVMSDTFSEIEDNHPDLIAIGAYGERNADVIDLPALERQEMAELSAPSELSKNVWLGPTVDPGLGAAYKKSKYDCCIEAGDTFQVHDTGNLDRIERLIRQVGTSGIVDMQAPGSGTITFEGDEGIGDQLLPLIQWVYRLANSDDDAKPGLRFLIHCADGYTETTLFALAYFMYAEGIPAHKAYVRLHRERGRNFFAYPGDKQLLQAIEQKILQASPKHVSQEFVATKHPIWFERMDGSFPSRVLPYLYLGNLTHATNPGLLKQLGIRRVLSVGEPISWPARDSQRSAADRLCWPPENFLYIDNVQDNGIDPLTCEFRRCLDFIEQSKKDGTATLVHCRVGVSRSATICIAEVMNELGLTFPRAYCFVRARRLNVIIQPHLRFTYELLKWEEYQCVRRGRSLRRELEWGTIAREIALMNRPYCGPR